MLPSHAQLLLDLGCHGGYLTEFMASISHAKKVVAIDVSEQAVSFVRERHPEWQALTGNVEDEYPVSEHSADLVTCVDVLEHLMNPEQVIAHAAKAIAPGGTMIIAVPHETIIWRTIWFFWTKYGPGRIWNDVHVQKFSLENLRQLFLKYGFTESQSRTIHLGTYRIISYIHA